MPELRSKSNEIEIKRESICDLEGVSNGSSGIVGGKRRLSTYISPWPSLVFLLLCCVEMEKQRQNTRMKIKKAICNLYEKKKKIHIIAQWFFNNMKQVCSPHFVHTSRKYVFAKVEHKRKCRWGKNSNLCSYLDLLGVSLLQSARYAPVCFIHNR